jgi:hypothetical protein
MAAVTPWIVRSQYCTGVSSDKQCASHIALEILHLVIQHGASLHFAERRSAVLRLFPRRTEIQVGCRMAGPPHETLVLGRSLSATCRRLQKNLDGHGRHWHGVSATVTTSM